MFGMPNMSSLLNGLALEYRLPFLFLFLEIDLVGLKTFLRLLVHSKENLSSSFNLSPTLAYLDSLYGMLPPVLGHFPSFLGVPKYSHPQRIQPI